MEYGDLKRNCSKFVEIQKLYGSPNCIFLYFHCMKNTKIQIAIFESDQYMMELLLSSTQSVLTKVPFNCFIGCVSDRVA